MIPKNINREAVLSAIQSIDENGIPKTRLSRTYNLRYNGRLYPPKYLISIANKIVNGTELEPFNFGGGTEANGFLIKLGFEVVPFSHTTEPAKKAKPDSFNVVTVVVENQSGNHPNNDDRLLFMQNIISENISANIILFPAGYFYFDYQRAFQINRLCNQISAFLKSIDRHSTVVFGIDCDNGKDQLAAAVSQDGIQAIGRKFHPTVDEDGFIREADSHNELEMGYPRIFKVNDKVIYLAVCYDGFGIRHCSLPNLGIDIVLVLAHQFWKRGEGPSGDVDFARKGFAGASQHWNCPVFGAAIFFCRDIPENWPTGVLWTDQSSSVRHFKYEDNKLTWSEKKELIGDFEKALCYKYVLPM